MWRSGVVLLAVVVLLAGCPGDSGTGTATPAPVPSLPEPTATPADSAPFRNCPVPTPAPPPATPAPRPTPSGPPAVPVTDGSVDPSAVVAHHDAALEDHRYRLVGPGLVVTATRNRSTMLVRTRASAAGISHYVADGRVHTYYYHEGGGSDRYSAGSYDGGPLPDVRGKKVSVTGSDTIRRTLAAFPHRVVRRRADDWTVLRATLEGPTVFGNRTIHHVRSTVVIDRRGIVRSLDRRVLVAVGPGQRRWQNRTLRVTDVGTATFDRPYWVCLAPERGTDVPATR